ncbi:MAG: iron-containing alcohol dehydrogenase, partial [Candidatus Brocadiales bacterium]|nr:iron-containing alcohol dehydrogenase [Candidatus Brocadiales bacterium]
PDLLASCPATIIAANGMDALTQLIESYVSLRQNSICNTLGEAAIRHVRDSLIPLFESKGQNSKAREKMAYGALVSGINLAQTGLGSVHGLASPLGAFFPMPHGVVCGTLLAKATEVNLLAMQQREPQNPALDAYKKVAQMLHGTHFPNHEVAFKALIKRLWLWTEKLDMPRLNTFGMQQSDIPQVVANSRGSSMLTNPIKLTDDEISSILRSRL